MQFADAKSDLARTFDCLTSDFYQAWFRFHPESALDAGVLGYETLLTPYADDDIGALTALLEKLLVSLEEIDPDRLDADRALDFRQLRGAMLVEHHEMQEFDWRHRDPQRYLPIDAIYQLTVRTVPDLAAALCARLAAIPDHLRGARARLAEMPALIPPLWLEDALVEARQGAEFLRTLPAHPEVARAFPNPARLTGLIDAAAHALEDFAHAMETEIGPQADGDHGCGRAHFERLLWFRHGLDIDADTLHDFGVELFDTTVREMQTLAREIDADSDIGTLLAGIQANHPEADALIAAYRSRMQAACEFVAVRRLVSLPPRQELKVIETPRFMRHRVPFAAYDAPSPDDPTQCGYYFVTPPDDAAGLREHNVTGMGLTCVHEAWPGHHLQFVTAHLNAAARSLPRLLHASATLYEGWALYCEQLMVESGFLDEPAARLLMLRDRLWRALRVQLDVELHTRGLSIEQAAARLQAALGFSHAQALGELSWYTRAPTVPMSYAAGWAMINALREKVRGSEADFELREFHDRLLSGGSAALPRVIERAFGVSQRQAVIEQVFGAAGRQEAPV